MIHARSLNLRRLTAGLVVVISCSVSLAGKPVIPAQKPIEEVATVKLFDAMQAEQVDVRLVHRDKSSGNLLIENLTDEPLNIQMPEAFVGVHVLNQGFFGNNGGGTFGSQSSQNSGQSQGGQVTGGGASSSGSSNIFSSNSLLPGIFSVRPEKIVRIPIRSVCLEHGRPEPALRMQYRIFPVERFSQDPALFELLTKVSQGHVSQNVAQAAAWNLASGKSWKQLAAMKFRRLGGLPDIPHFRTSELSQAQKLAEKLQLQAEAKAAGSTDSTVAASVVVRPELPVR